MAVALSWSKDGSLGGVRVRRFGICASGRSLRIPDVNGGTQAQIRRPLGSVRQMRPMLVRRIDGLKSPVP